jgi:hypothetical protein
MITPSRFSDSILRVIGYAPGQRTMREICASTSERCP